jgi:hypothetical protein
MRRITLLLVLVATSALGQIRSDQPLAPVVLGAAPARQESARVASDGTNFFAVWRTSTASNAVIGGGRVSPAGELLDRPSILIASGAAGTLGYPDVFFVGGNFLVVYGSGTYRMARRVSREGRLVDQQAVVINTPIYWGQLASNGDNVLMITSANSIRMLAADGTPLGADRILPNVEFHSNPSVTSNGSQYLIAEADRYASRGSFTILNSRGDLELSNAFSIPDPFYISGLTVTSNGSAFLMMLVSSGRIAFMPIDSAGNTGPLRKTDYPTDGTIVATWSGNEYTLAWTTPPTSNYAHTQILAARVDAAGLPLDTAPVAITPLQSGVNPFAIASNGRDSIIITRENDYTGWRTTAAIFTSLPQIDAEPAARRRVAIASSAPEQAGGSIASNGTLSLVTWRETSGLDQAVVRAAFIAADGQLGAPIDLGDADFRATTATASNGRDFLVVYVDPLYQLVARRVTLEGVLDSTPIVINRYGMATDALAAGWSGQAYVVVTTGYSAVTISSVTPDGTVALSPQAISTEAPADSPAVSCAANGCSVTWHWASPACYVLCSYTENDVFARTDTTGNLVAQAVLTDFDFVTPALPLATSDGRSLFVYSFLYSNSNAMFAGRITAGGVVLDTPSGRRVMTSETSFSLQPVAVVNRGLYFVEPDTSSIGRLYWTRIEPEPAPHVTSLVNLHQSLTLPLTLTASARNTYLVYSRGEDDEKLMAPRLFLRTLASPDPQPGTPRRRSTR